MLLLHENSIRETIAFPKNQQSKCLTTDAPNKVAEDQLEDLNVKSTFEENHT